jgi:phosphatidylglycerophosphatase A
VKRVVRNVAWAVATWFGCGLSPWAPGTAGTLGAIPLYLVARLGGCPGVAATATLVFFSGVWAASVVARERGLKDPQLVVVDEVAGFLLTMLPVRALSWRAVSVGFLVFRVLDIVKPWPARQLEDLPSGWGIVLDDVAAGVYGAGIMTLLQGMGAFG